MLLQSLTHDDTNLAFFSVAAPTFKDAFDAVDCSALNALNGFVFVLSKDGDLIYLSENVERHLGLTHIDMMGQSIYDYSHPCDHDDIKLFLEPLTSAFNASKYLPKPGERKTATEEGGLMGKSTGNFFIRMKCTLTSKGRNCNLKSANFKASRSFFPFVLLVTVSFLLSLCRLSSALVVWWIWRLPILRWRKI